MSKPTQSRLSEILQKFQEEILADWIKEQLAAITLRADLLNESELRRQSNDFLVLIREAAQQGNLTDITSSEWSKTREFLSSVSHSRVKSGFTPSETLTFVLSLKQPLFSKLIGEIQDDAGQLGEELWITTVLLDKLGLYTMDVFTKGREEIISKQRMDIYEISTPIIQVWDGILAIPIIGMLDSSRTQDIMEKLLEKIIATRSQIAIIDITAVPTVDTLVAQHLLKTVSAIKMLGAEGIITGISAAIAQTIVHLGIELKGVITKPLMADGIKLALETIKKPAGSLTTNVSH